MKTDGLRGADETNRSVEPGVVRDRETGQAELDRTLDKVLSGRCPVEKGEIGVAMEFGVWDLLHGSLRSTRLTGGCSS
jgi:hypothetical protein